MIFKGEFMKLTAEYISGKLICGQLREGDTARNLQASEVVELMDKHKLTEANGSTFRNDTNDCKTITWEFEVK